MTIEFHKTNSVGVITLNNPQKLNALSSEFIEEFYSKIQKLDESINVLILRGCGKSFAAGVDIEEIKKTSFEESYKRDFIDHKWECIRNLNIPVIAEISGYALGGGFELALMSDIIIADSNAKFSFPEINLGLMPGMGGTQMLTHIVGSKISSEIIMTGRFIHAQEALELKIISKLFDPDLLQKKTMELAESISTKSKLSLRFIKDAIKISQNVGLDQGMKTERHLFRSLLSSESKKLAITDFFKKKG